MSITCFIEYKINPCQHTQFQRYAHAWGEIIPRCGGALVGYFIPYEGNNTKAFGLIAFENLAAYEQYRLRLKQDEQAKENFAFAQREGFILEEQRNFLTAVEGTAPHLAAPWRP